MNSAVKPVVSILKVNSLLPVNSFKDVSEELSLKRPNRKTNSMLFVLLHTLDARFFMLRELGVNIKNPFGKYLDWANTIDDIKKYPKLKRVISEWEKTDGVLIKKISSLTPKKINKETSINFPDGKKIINMITFLAEHEAYHVGQLAFIRKFLGMTAVTF
jgi:hypothetical protein